MSLILYELFGEQGVRYSQFAWRTRMALAHKGLDFEARGVAVRDKAAIAFSGQDKVPVLICGEEIVCDSWRIAEFLEEYASEGASLFGGAAGRALTRFVNAYVDRTLIPVLAPMLMVDVVGCVDVEDGRHLRTQIEAAFGASLEALAEARPRDIVAFRRLLDPLRTSLRAQPFLCGPKAGYADYILFSLFQWARVASAFPVLADGDLLVEWRDRMLDLHDALARREPARVERDGVR